jgi:excinuclease ABC subunit C
LEAFGSVAALRKALVEEIALVPGIGEKIANQIFQALAALEVPAPKINTQTGEIIAPD